MGLWKKCFDASRLCYTLGALETFLPEKPRRPRGKVAASCSFPAWAKKLPVKMLRLVGTLAVSLLLFGVVPSPAQIISYVDEHGRRVFTNEQIKPTSGQFEPAVTSRRAWLPGIDTHINRTAQRHGIEPKLVNAIIEVESGWDTWAVSHRGAVGLMQLLPETGRRFGANNLLDPEQNITAGIRYLRFLLDRFGGNLELSLAAYNAGENIVTELGEIPPYPETQKYIERIMALYNKGATNQGQRARAVAPERIYPLRDANGRMVYVNF